MDRQKRKILRISIPEKEYEQLRILAEQGMRTVPAYSQQIILRYLRKIKRGELEDGWGLNERVDLTNALYG